MKIAISFKKTPGSGADTAIIPVFKGGRLDGTAQKLDDRTGGLISSHLKNNRKFTGKAGETLVLTAAGKAGHRRIVVLGLGEPAALTAQTAESAGGRLYTALDAAGAVRAEFFCPAGKTGALPAADFACALATGLRLRAYDFTKYRSKTAADKAAAALNAVTFTGPAAAGSAKAYKHAAAMAEGVFFARDLVNEPPNKLYPESFAARIKSELGPLGVAVEIIDHRKMQKLGFEAALAVGMGSARPPRIVVMRWNGAGKPGAGPGKKSAAGPLAFVGKGVTFDTGGINIKPSDGLAEMKLDMGGAAAVIGLMKTLALRNAKADVVGIVGLAENMPSHNAYRPSDIIGSLSGKTIEVLNTDAEGRLVLADCLTYVQRTYKPQLVIDLATLTGAMMVALGSEYCGTFVNDDKLWIRLEAASAASGEKLWRMPLDEVFKKDMTGKIADLQNLGTMGRYAGACTAAGFLEHFIEGKTPWAHLDIAGTAWIKADRATCPKPATGFGVRVLDRLVADHYE